MRPQSGLSPMDTSGGQQRLKALPRLCRRTCRATGTRPGSLDRTSMQCLQPTLPIAARRAPAGCAFFQHDMTRCAATRRCTSSSCSRSEPAEHGRQPGARRGGRRRKDKQELMLDARPSSPRC
ncbi:MAG: hypothetical protein MZW92_00105 [Comamonadaceae bacterium]|nr:hypothetical protein [Comamonadaceae bacterium]